MKLFASLKTHFVVWVWNHTPRCAEMSRLTSRSLEQPLAVKTRLKMRLHWINAIAGAPPAELSMLSRPEIDMDLVVAVPEREMPGCMPEIRRLRNPLTVLGLRLPGVRRFRSLSVLRGRKSRGSSAEKKGRRGGRESDLGEHNLISCLCCCFVLLLTPSWCLPGEPRCFPTVGM